jgi:hypothetical protein
MCKLYGFNTRIGPFYIARLNGWYHPVHENEPLGRYSTPEEAVEAIARGRVPSVNSLADVATLGIPKELGRWEFLH